MTEDVNRPLHPVVKYIVCAHSIFLRKQEEMIGHFNLSRYTGSLVWFHMCLSHTASSVCIFLHSAQHAAQPTAQHNTQPTTGHFRSCRDASSQGVIAAFPPLKLNLKLLNGVSITNYWKFGFCQEIACGINIVSVALMFNCKQSKISEFIIMSDLSNMFVFHTECMNF